MSEDRNAKKPGFMQKYRYGRMNLVSLSIIAVALLSVFAIISQPYILDKIVAFALNAPTADAGPDQNVFEGETVNLDGSGSLSNVEPRVELTYLWEAIAGPEVTLSNYDIAKPSFVAPAVNVLKTLTFKLTVTDSGGVNSDTVDVKVKPATITNPDVLCPTCSPAKHARWDVDELTYSFGVEGRPGIIGQVKVDLGDGHTRTVNIAGPGPYSTLPFTYSSDETGKVEMIVAELRTPNGVGTLEFTTDAISATVLQHEVDFTLLSLLHPNGKWGFPNEISGIMIDKDAGNAGVPNKTVSPIGGAVESHKVVPVSGVTGSSGEFVIPFTISQDVNPVSPITVRFSGDGLYKEKEATAQSLTMRIETHATTTELTFPVAVKWFYGFDANVIVHDNNAGGVSYHPDPQPIVPVTITGDAVDPGNPAATTGGPSGSPIHVVASQNTGLTKSVVATFAGNGLYAGSSDPKTMTIQEHGLTVKLDDVPNLGWELKRNLAGHVEDPDSGVDSSRTANTPVKPSGIGAITFDGTGIGTNAAVTFTGSGGVFSSPGRAPNAPAVSGLKVQAHYDGNSALYGPGDSEIKTYATLEHHTGIDLNYNNENINPANLQFLPLFDNPDTTDIASVKKQGKAAIGGTLLDTDFRNEGTLDRIEITRPETISFTEAGPPSLKLNLPNADLQGLSFVGKFAGDIEIVECAVGENLCSVDSPVPFGADPTLSSNMLVSVKVGSKLVFNSATFDAQVYLQDIGTRTVGFTVRENNHVEHNESITGAAPGDKVVTLLQVTSGNELVSGTPVPQGLTEIEFTAIPGNGRLGIGAVIVHAIDGRNPISRTFALNFENEVARTPTSPYVAHPAAFTSIGTAPNNVANDLEIKAKFSGETGYYLAAPDRSGFIDIILDTSGVTSSVSGSVPVAVTGSLGTTFSGYPCAVGNDDDEDGVCNNWEDAGVITAGGGTYDFHTLPAADLPSTLIRDIYVEVDGFSAQMFTPTTLSQISGVFDDLKSKDSLGRPYKLHIIRDDTTITEKYPLHVWSDTSSSWMRNTGQTQTVTKAAGTDRIRDFTISGISIGTTGAVSGHKLELRVTATFSASPGSFTASAVTFPTIGLSKSVAISSLTAAAGAPIISASTATIPITLTYTSTGAAGVIDLGTTTVRITLPTGKDSVSLLSPVVTATGNGVVSNNDDFDGIKRNYFGTAAERGTGNSLAKNSANLVAKAQVFHYAFIGRTSGPSTTSCGSSGWAEQGGNDMLVTLGAKSSANCFTGTAGSTDEQKGTFLHELGHTLGLRHNGNTDDNCAPNYVSVMNYAKQIPIANFGVWRADYSHQALHSLDERLPGTGVAGINEGSGGDLSLNSNWPVSSVQIVAGNGAGTPFLITIDGTTHVIDFNRAGGSAELLKGFDINYFSTVRGCDVASPSPSLSVLAGFNDWFNLQPAFVNSGVSNDGYPSNSNDDINGDPTDPNSVFGSLIIEANDGKFIGLSRLLDTPSITLEQLTGVKGITKGSVEVLKFQYQDKNGQFYPGSTVIKLEIVSVADATTFTPIAHKNVLSDAFKEDPVSHTWTYKLDTGKVPLQINTVYGLKIYRLDSDGTKTVLDVNTDGFAGYFFFKK